MSLSFRLQFTFSSVQSNSQQIIRHLMAVALVYLFDNFMENLTFHCSEGAKTNFRKRNIEQAIANTRVWVAVWRFFVVSTVEYLTGGLDRGDITKQNHFILFYMNLKYFNHCILHQKQKIYLTCISDWDHLKAIEVDWFSLGYSGADLFRRWSIFKTTKLRQLFPVQIHSFRVLCPIQIQKMVTIEWKLVFDEN